MRISPAFSLQSGHWVLGSLFAGFFLGISMMPFANAAEPKDVIVQTECLLQVFDQVDLSARRDGIVDQVVKRTGEDVSAGERILRLSTKQALANLAVAQARYDRAFVRASDDSGIQTAEIELERSTEEAALLEEVGRVPYLERFRAQNLKQRNTTELQSARITHEEDLRAAEVASAELRVAQLDLDDRTVAAPFDGTIVQQYKYQGDWCSQGDPVLKLLRMDKLMLQGIVNIKDIAPHEIMGSKVSVTLAIAGQKPLEIANLTIDRVSPEVGLDGNYLVWTFVQNKKQLARNGQQQWVLRPGLNGTMTIYEGGRPGDEDYARR